MRARDLNRFTAAPYDLLVIGGGIYGLAIAYEAGSRGLRAVPGRGACVRVPADRRSPVAGRRCGAAAVEHADERGQIGGAPGVVGVTGRLERADLREDDALTGQDVHQGQQGRAGVAVLRRLLAHVQVRSQPYSPGAFARPAWRAPTGIGVCV